MRINVSLRSAASNPIIYPLLDSHPIPHQSAYNKNIWCGLKLKRTKFGCGTGLSKARKLSEFLVPESHYCMGSMAKWTYMCHNSYKAKGCVSWFEEVLDAWILLWFEGPCAKDQWMTYTVLYHSHWFFSIYITDNPFSTLQHIFNECRKIKW